MQYCLEAIENHYKPKTPLPLIHIHQMLKFILENNYFTFDNKFYLQVHGTAMGTPFAPNYANIFMAKIENQILNNEQQIYKTPLLWKRFIEKLKSNGKIQILTNLKRNTVKHYQIIHVNTNICER